MIAVQNPSASRSKLPPKPNRSSTTKASRKNRKKALSVNDVRKKVDAMLR